MIFLPGAIAITMGPKGLAPYVPPAFNAVVLTFVGQAPYTPPTFNTVQLKWT